MLGSEKSPRKIRKPGQKRYEKFGKVDFFDVDRKAGIFCAKMVMGDRFSGKRLSGLGPGMMRVDIAQIVA